MINVLIIEDELPAQENLKKAIIRNFDNLHIMGVESSVTGAVKWLSNTENRPDIIFMDVELSDGMCFDIFSRVDVTAKVIITTAYDNYAVRAFKINCIDYLLKPIDQDELRQAVARCRKALSTEPIDAATLRSALIPENRNVYKKRFVVRLGDKILVTDTTDVAYFYAEDKSTYLVTTEGKRYILDTSLDAASEQLDPSNFFRISRNCTASIGSIRGISKHLSNRLKVTLEPKTDEELFVSRTRTSDFMNWLEDKK